MLDLFQFHVRENKNGENIPVKCIKKKTKRKKKPIGFSWKILGSAHFKRTKYSDWSLKLPSPSTLKSRGSLPERSC